MGRLARTLTVNLVGRDDSLQKTYKRVNKGSALMSDNLRKAARVGGIGLTALGGAAIGAAAMLKPMLNMAASVEESLDKNNIVFGESSALVEKFAETSLKSFGVTRNAALEATGVIGTLGTAMGISEEESASMATTLVGLAGDMASFGDVSVEETLLALQSGLRGEAEPLRRFGVLLDAATLKAKALEEGIISNTKSALTPQQKALAAYKVILEQTAIQAGNWEQTIDSATNQQKLLKGTFVELSTSIGKTLLPAFTAIVTHLNDVIIPEIIDFWNDPSWRGAGEITAKVLGSDFFDNVLGSIKGPTEQEIRQQPWYMAWESSSEIALVVSGFKAAIGFAKGLEDGFNDPRIFGDPFKGERGEQLDPDVQAILEGVGKRFAEAVQKGFDEEGLDITGFLPENLFPGGGGMPGSAPPPPPPPEPDPNNPEGGHTLQPPKIQPGPPAPKIQPGPGLGGLFPGHTFPILPPQTGVLGGTAVDPMAINPNTGLSQEEALRILSDPAMANNLDPLRPGHTMDPGQRGAMSMTVVVNGVSGKEVVDALGQYVDENGPLSSSLVA